MGLVREFSAVAGLGNPGSKYENTRHNIGFLFVERCAERWVAPGQQVGWKSKFGADFCDGFLGTDKQLLVKPLQYMNVSGPPTQQLLNYRRIEPEKLLVVHDEVDLPFGSIRLKRGGGEAGHNGLRSLSSALGTKNYLRLRLGVGRPDSSEGKSRQQLSSWVLGKFDSAERQELDIFLGRAIQAAEYLFEHGLKRAQNEWNG